MNRRLTVVLLSVLVASALVYYFISTHEPSYNGKALSQWLADFDNVSMEARAEAAEAVRQMGKDALPLIITQLQRHDSALKLKLVGLARHQSFVKMHAVAAEQYQRQALAACDALGAGAKPALPALEKLYLAKKPHPDAPYVIARIGPDGAALLARALTNNAIVTDEPKYIRLSAQACLNMIASRSEVLFPGTNAAPLDRDFSRRLCAFHIAVMSAALKDYKAHHPETSFPNRTTSLGTETEITLQLLKQETDALTNGRLKPQAIQPPNPFE